MNDFRNETIYFIVVDRFFDGDPGNNVGKDRDFDATRTDPWRWWGGDLQGVLDQLDYIQSTGATAIWLTPLFDQIDGVLAIDGKHMAPYHGYWAKDFKRLDEHLVQSPTDVRLFAHSDTVFDRLVAAMHARGMKLVLDIVCNHSSPHLGGNRSELFDDGKPIATYDGANKGWYRHGGEVTDWNDLSQVQTRDLAGLADFNEESADYRRYIKEAMRMWLDKGVDAFRVDTVKHMPLWFWQEFTGDMLVHKPELFLVGEWFLGGCFDRESVEFANRSGMGILDFGWRNAVISALASGAPSGFREIAAVVELDHLFRDVNENVTFVDNHDVPRFLSISNDPARFRLATLLTLVARGIPCLYYGGEQGLHDDRNGGNDPYNRPMMPSFQPTALAAEYKTLADLRHRSPALQKAGMRTKHLGTEHWAFTRKYMNAVCLAAVNRSDEPVDLALTDVELPDGRYDELLGGASIEVIGGVTRVTVPPCGIVVYQHLGAQPAGPALVDLQVHGIRTLYGEQLFVCGNVPELGSWDPALAVPMEYVNAASWAVTVPFEASCGRELHYKFLVKQGAHVRREPGLGHHRTAPTAGRSIWRDAWRT